MYVGYEKDEVKVHQLSESIDLIKKYVTICKGDGDDFEKQMAFDAILNRMLTMCELLQETSDVFKEFYVPYFDFKRLRKTRNVIAHNAYNVDKNCITNFMKREFGQMESAVMQFNQNKPRN